MKSLLESQFNLSSVEVDVLLDYYTTHKLIYESLGNAQ